MFQRYRRFLFAGVKKGTEKWLVGYVVLMAVGLYFVTEAVSRRQFANCQLVPGQSQHAADMGAGNCHLGSEKQVGEGGRVADATLPDNRKEAGAASKVQAHPQADGSTVKTILFEDMLIDRLYPSMEGPKKVHHVLFGDSAERNVWITRYAARVLDADSGKASQEFMCHTSLDLLGLAGTEAQNYHRQLLTVSQGQEEIVFPEGFALRYPNDPLVENHVLVMVLNNNDPGLKKTFDFETRIQFYGDEAAAKKGLVPLFQTGMSIVPLLEGEPLKPGETAAKSATEVEIEVGPDGRRRSGHWMVPPGRQVMKQRSKLELAQDTTLHYIWMHVHPYAESVELRDATEDRTIWKGKVTNNPDPKRAHILVTDHFSSREGVPLYKGHEYEFVCTYDNPTDHDVDAMASLWMYAKASQ